MKKFFYINLYLLSILLILTFISIFFIGRIKINILDVFYLENFKHIMLYIRLPRIIAAIVIGMSLSVSGAVYQGIFRNPLVSPDILGASSGCSFGIGLGIILHFSYLETIFLAFLFGIFVVFSSYFLSTFLKNDEKTSLILSGLMLSTIFTSLLSYLKLVADIDNELPDITYWLMGRLTGISYSTIKIIVLPILFIIFSIFLLRWKINFFMLNESEANLLGINMKVIRIILIISSTLLTAIAVSVSGVIGFVGLIVPHFSRALVGNNYRFLIPTSVTMGALFLLVIDNFSRSLTTYEIPLGILTSLVGAPLFLFLLIRKKR